jgi:hypothetical protein
MVPSNWKNKLFYGDNLDVLREHIADDSVDLIYLDPPFNSKRDYNLLFKTPKKPVKAAAKKAIASKDDADGGIDGLLWPEVYKGKTEKVILQVKGGMNVTRENIATLVGHVRREKAAMGLFIMLVEPTREMVKEVSAAAGMYESPHHGAFPKIQILTIKGLLSGKDRPQFPDLSRGEQTFKKAKREKSDDATKQGTLI